jgi:hypothetical protein
MKKPIESIALALTVALIGLYGLNRAFASSPEILEGKPSTGRYVLYPVSTVRIDHSRDLTNKESPTYNETELYRLDTWTGRTWRFSSVWIELREQSK